MFCWSSSLVTLLDKLNIFRDSGSFLGVYSNSISEDMSQDH